MRAAFFTLLARLHELRRPAAADADFDQELAAHLAMAEDEYIRNGMNPGEARRQARLALGGVMQVRESARAARGLPWLETFWLDGRLGLRRLRKSWGLTLVGGLAMAVTIGLGASITTIWDAFAGTSLPLDDGDRVVAIQLVDRTAQQVQAAPVADVGRWRELLTSLEEISAMRAWTPTVVMRDSATAPVAAAEMTASGFELARVQPILGRPLVAEDERPGAEPVAVISASLWRTGYASDPTVIGQRIQIDDTPHVVVGVMPESFRFPVNQRLWTPLRVNAVGEPASANGVFVFARLAPDATLERAQRELETRGVLPSSTAIHNGVPPQPRVLPYAAGFFPDVHANSWLSGVLFAVAALLLLPPCANIAILVYARTLARREEFAARTALGASRGRIVMQLFVELLVLAAIAGVAGLLLARQFSGRLPMLFMPGMGPQNVPFWLDFTPSLVTVGRVAALCVLAAAIAGAIPAFHVTGRWRRPGPSGLTSRGTVRLGKTWTTLLAGQVAVTLAILPAASEMLWGIFRPTIAGPAFPVQQFLTAALSLDGTPRRLETLQGQAIAQLRAEGGISGATVSASPLMLEPDANIEVEGRPGSDEQVRFNVVDNAFFDVFGARLLAGRPFAAADFQPGSTAVIVNRSFLAEVLGEGTGLGRRVHYLDTRQARESTPPPGSHEIVGVVEDFPGTNDGPIMFHPMTTPMGRVAVTIRDRSGAGQSADRLRAALTRIGPQLRVGRVQSVADMYWQRRSLDWTFGAMLGSVTLIVVLFSMAGLYTLMTFVVAQRWQEIGVRSALGAQPRRLLTGIFGRALLPLLIGAGAGCVLAIGIDGMLPITEAGGQHIPGVIPLAAASMLVAGLLAVTAPARRAIRIDPTEVLRRC